MGLADRDYMRERAHYRAGRRGHDGPGGPSRHQRRTTGKSVPGYVILGIVVGFATVHIMRITERDRQPRVEINGPPAVASQQVVNDPGTAIPRVTAESQERTSITTEAVSTISTVQPSARVDAIDDQREIVPILNGARTQDLSHIKASTVGDTGGYFPANGATEWFVPIGAEHATGRLTIIDQDGTDTAKIFRIRQAESGIVIVQVYVQSGQGAFLDLPLGNYTLTVARGDRWYGRPKYFGPEGTYLNALQLIQISPGGTTERLLPSGAGGRQMMTQPGRAF